MCDEDDEKYGKLGAEVIITAQPIGGQNVDFLCSQYQVKIYIARHPQEPARDYIPVEMHVKWWDGGTVVQDSTYVFGLPETTWTRATFLYAEPGHYLDGKFTVEISAPNYMAEAVESDTAFCTIGRQQFPIK